MKMRIVLSRKPVSWSSASSLAILSSMLAIIPKNPAGMIDRLLEATLLRQVRIAVAQVPLAEVSGAIAVGGEDLRHRGNPPPDERPSGTDGRRPVVQGVEPRHQLAACRRAHWRHVK